MILLSFSNNKLNWVFELLPYHIKISHWDYFSIFSNKKQIIIKFLVVFLIFSLIGNIFGAPIYTKNRNNLNRKKFLHNKQEFNIDPPSTKQYSLNINEDTHINYDISSLYFSTPQEKYNDLNYNNEVSFYTHGDITAVNTMKLEFNWVNLNNTNEKFFSEGLKSDIGSRNYSFVCATFYFSLAITENQDVVFFGRIGNYFGDMSLNSFPKIIWNVDKEIMGTVEQLECGGDFAFIRTNLNFLFTFGSNRFGQLGLGPLTIQSPTFSYHNSLTTIKRVSAGSFHSLYLDENNQVYISGLLLFIPPILITEKLIFEDPNHKLNITHFSASRTGGVLVGNDSCLYAYGNMFGGDYTQPIVFKLNITCNHKEAYLNSETLSIYSLNNNYEFTNYTYDVESKLFLKKIIFSNFNENSIKEFNSMGNFVIISLTNNTVLGYGTNQIFLPAQLSLVKIPEISFGDDSHVRKLHCAIEHCVLIGPSKTLYTIGTGHLKTCNRIVTNLINECKGYNTQNIGKVYTVAPFFLDECKIAILQNNYNATYLTIKNCFSDTGDQEVDALNYYPFRELYISSPVFSTVDNTIFELNSKFFSNETITLKLDLSLFGNIDDINLQNFDCYNMECYVRDTKSQKILSHFDDFLYSTTISSMRSLSSRIFVLFHISRGKFSKSLAIIEQDKLNNEFSAYYMIHGVDYFWISFLPFYLSSSDTILFVGLKEKNCTIFTMILDEKQLNEYNPSNIENCIPLAKIVSIVDQIYYSSNFLVLSKNGKIYIAQIDLSLNTYELEEIILYNNSNWQIGENNKLNDIQRINETFIHISMTNDRSIYLLSKNHDAYYLSTNFTYNILLSNVSRFQSFHILNAQGIQLYQNIKCNGIAADDLKVCNGRGICTLHEHCICFDNWYGDNCNNRINYTCNGFNPIFKDACNGRGECKEKDKCNCKKPYYGNLCENYCDFQIIDLKIFNFCISLSNSYFFIVTIAIFTSICLFSFIVFIFSFFTLLYCYQYLLYKSNQTNLKSKINELIRDQELDLLDDDKKAWELNKKHFQISSSELQILRKIGSGGEGIVYEAKWKNLIVAIKYFNFRFMTEETIIQNFKKESNLMSSLRHPNIITFYGATLSFPRVGFIMEYIPSSVDIFIESDESKKASKHKLIGILIDVCSAMSYLHENNIIHRDLKWQNVLLTKNHQCKITDFGLSKFEDSFSEKHTHNIGTGFYIAPENYNGLDYDNKVDVYSFGIMIFELLCGIMNPWAIDESTKDLSIIRITSLAANNPNFRPNVKYLKESGYENFIPICQKCWDHNPKDRPSFDNLLLEILSFDT